MKLYRFILTIIFLAILLSISPIQVLSQENYEEYFSENKKNALGITPAVNEVILEENIPITKEITVNNLTNFALPVKVFIESLTPKETELIPNEMLERYDSTKWFNLEDSDKDFILQPKQSKKIKVAIKQPKNTNPGGYYASLILQPLIPEQFYSKDSVYIFTRIASVFLLQVKGDIKEEIKLEKFSLPIVSEREKINVSMTIKNEGNTHTRPLVKLKFKELIRNRELDQLNLKPEIVLPALKGEVVGEYNGLPSFGIVEIETLVSYGPSNIQLQIPKKYLFVIPYRTILLIIFLVLILIFVTKYRERMKKAIKVLIEGEKKSERAEIYIGKEKFTSKKKRVGTKKEN